MTVQARAEALEAQVAATTARLQELRDSQRRLEARNALLETAASLNVTDETDLSVVTHIPAHKNGLDPPLARWPAPQALTLSKTLYVQLRMLSSMSARSTVKYKKMSQHHSAVLGTSHSCS